MDLLVLDPAVSEAMIAQRRESGGDRFDEVWEGLYLMSPWANNEHQHLTLKLARVFDEVIGDPHLGRVQAGANVSDRADGWEHNYRCPDVVVYLNDNPAVDHDTHWQGGPDFAVEVVSRYDRSRMKFAFYGLVGTRELLIVDRYPWALELYRRNEVGHYDLVGRSEPDDPSVVPSGVLPLTFRLEVRGEKPRIVLTHMGDERIWTI